MELTFGEMLLIGLKRQGLRYQDAAEALGVTKQSIQGYVAGITVPNSETKIKRLSEIMRLDANDTEVFGEKYQAFCKARPVRHAGLRTQLRAQKKYIAQLEDRIKELEGRK